MEMPSVSRAYFRSYLYCQPTKNCRKPLTKWTKIQRSNLKTMKNLMDLQALRVKTRMRKKK